MKNIRVIQQSIKEPINTEIGWLKPVLNGFLLNFYNNGLWKSVVTPVKVASTDDIGGIKVSKLNDSLVLVNNENPPINRYYPIELNLDYSAIVNVPWFDTKDTAGSIHTNNKLYLIGAEDQSEWSPTASNSYCYIHNGRLYSADSECLNKEAELVSYLQFLPYNNITTHAIHYSKNSDPNFDGYIQSAAPYSMYELSYEELNLELQIYLNCSERSWNNLIFLFVYTLNIKLFIDNIVYNSLINNFEGNINFVSDLPEQVVSHIKYLYTVYSKDGISTFSSGSLYSLNPLKDNDYTILDIMCYYNERIGWSIYIKLEVFLNSEDW